jgi:hypothetical protein
LHHQLVQEREQAGDVQAEQLLLLLGRQVRGGARDNPQADPREESGEGAGQEVPGIC